MSETLSAQELSDLAFWRSRNPKIAATYSIDRMLDHIAAAEAALAACEPMRQLLLQFVKEYGESSEQAADQRAAERHFIAAVNYFGQI